MKRMTMTTATALYSCVLAVAAYHPVMYGDDVEMERKAGDTQTIALPGNVALHLTWIPAGEFLMGQADDEQDAYPNKETPQHPVSISHGFWMGRNELTQAQWQALMGTVPWLGRDYVADDPNSPAVYVNWHDAQLFAEALTRYTGMSFRLPTEAEWEYACRAGTTTRFYWGDDPDYSELGSHAWWRGNALTSEQKHARRVGLLGPNPWGLFDLGGNVSEWCADWHWFYFDGPATDPKGPASADHRVLRGGSWMSTGGRCRSSRRDHDVPEAAHSHIGFRVVLGEPGQVDPGTPAFSDVFVAGRERVDTYRIPSLLVSPDGALLAFCEARKQSQDDASPTDIVLRRSADNGRTWLDMQTLARGAGEEALMNPCPVFNRANKTVILLCMKANGVSEGHNRLYSIRSADNGQSWSAPVEIGDRVVGFDDTFVPGPGIGIQMRNGRLVIPGYSGAVDAELDENFHARTMYSDDGGETWTMGATVDALSDESQVVELDDGTLMLNMRGNMGMSCRGVARSDDGGQTWSAVHWDQALNECPCQASIIRFSAVESDTDGPLLFANPDNKGEYFGVVERTKLTIRVSYDEGRTWPVKRLIHAGPASYSCLARLSDGQVGILFEGGEKHRREWIRFARFSIDWLDDAVQRP